MIGHATHTLNKTHIPRYQEFSFFLFKLKIHEVNNSFFLFDRSLHDCVVVPVGIILAYMPYAKNELSIGV